MARTPILPTESGSCLLRDATGAWDCDARPLANVADPTDPQDVATKSYVDAAGPATTIAADWTYDARPLGAPPAAGTLRTNATAGLSLATILAIATRTAAGADVTAPFRQLLAGDHLAVQVPDGWIDFELTEAPAVQADGAWVRCAVLAIAFAGITAVPNQGTVTVRASERASVTRATLVELLADLRVVKAALAGL